MKLSMIVTVIWYSNLPKPFAYVLFLFFAFTANLTASAQSDTEKLPMNYEVSMDANRLSTLYTLSFADHRIDTSISSDFCLYFTLETYRTNTFIGDLAMFLRTVGRQLMMWSVLGNPDELDSGSPAHPVLHDLTYCWDGVTCGYGILQFIAPYVSVMNIRRMFHQTSRVCNPLCQDHRYEYVASGVFSDVERASIPSVFAEIEIAARYVHSASSYSTPLDDDDFRELCDKCSIASETLDHAARLPN